MTGLATAIRGVLKSTRGALTPVQVRDDLRAAGYDLRQHKNPLASIHSCLRRFAESGNAERNGTAYRWIGRSGRDALLDTVTTQLRAVVHQMTEGEASNFIDVDELDEFNEGSLGAEEAAARRDLSWCREQLSNLLRLIEER